VGLVVGDATGKGVPAALVMSTTCGMLQSAARALGSSSPGEVLAQVNETLVARIPSNMFVTCFYASWSPRAPPCATPKPATTYLTYIGVVAIARS
jgi:serine phosphatase RsbU (regulator of sigma subunit)